MKKVIVLIAFCFLVTSLKAQSNFVKGVLLDENNAPLPFANALLLNHTDSTLIKAVTSNTDGQFEFNEIEEGAFLISLSMVGYKTYYTPKFILNAKNPKLDLKTINLEIEANTLEDVKVVAKKPFIEQQIDKTIVNVENSIVATGSSALEVLEKSPGVRVDRQSNTLNLKNKNGVLVMIDGRKNYMSNEALMEFLNNMSSDQIHSIEIITNPSSKYDASGNAGIINIKLKKNQMFGTNGTVSVTAGRFFFPKNADDPYNGNVNLSLNHRTQKFNAFGNFTKGKNTWYNENVLNRNVNDGELLSVFNQISTRNGLGLYNTGKAGVDFFLTKKTTLGFMADYSGWSGNMDANGNTSINEIRNEDSVKSSLRQVSLQDISNKNYSANINLKHEFNDKGKEMTVDLDYSGFKNNSSIDFDTKYFSEENSLTSQVLQRNSLPTNIDIIAAKVDFVIPTANKIKFEYGAKSSYVNTDNDFVFETLIDDTWQSDEGKTNHFTYKEFVNAAYVNVGYQFKKIGVQAGLRAEHTNSEGNSLTLDQLKDYNYWNLFPTLFLNQKINEKHSLKYSYSRRIGRPNYSQLNPFIFFLDPYTYEKGNPFLLPEYTNNMEVGYMHKSGLSLTLGYANTHGNIFQVIEQEDVSRVTYQTTINLDKSENYSLGLSFPITVTKWWIMQNNASVYYNRFIDDNISGAALNAGTVAYDFNSSNTFSMKKGWSAEASVWYVSPNVFGIVRSLRPRYAFNLGVQKTLLEKKAKLKLSASDVFLTSFWKGGINYQNIDLNIANKWASQRVSLTFSYNFGNQKVKASRQRAGASDDLKNRAGGNN